jgi:hypothetical protein
LSFRALRYWKWGNVPEEIRNEFHANDATIAKRASTTLSFSRIAFQELGLPPIKWIGGAQRVGI